MLNKKISGTSKLALLFNLLLIGGALSKVISSDRYLFKVLDQTISLQDLQYQARNLEALNCAYDDAFVIQYFGKDLIKDWGQFLKDFPLKGNEEASRYMHQHEELLKKMRYFYKVLRYAYDQKLVVSEDVTKLIRSATKDNKCDTEILHKETLKTNFIGLLRMELYFRSRYGNQLKAGTSHFNTIRPSIDLFVESLDKQFLHEYYW